MTDQKQSPERIIGVLLEGEGSVLIPRSLLRKMVEEKDSAIKQRDELAAEVERLKVHAENGWHQYRHWAGRYEAASKERDQALASVGAVIEQSVSVIEVAALALARGGWNDYAEAFLAVIPSLREINPDATADLNEMLAEAWVEGMWVGLGEDSPPINDNPYRTQPSRSSDAGKSEDRG